MESWINLPIVSANITGTGGLSLDSTLQTIDADLKLHQPRNIFDSLGNSLNSTSGALNVQVTNTSIPVSSAVSASSAVTRVISSASNVQILAPNANRKGVILFNESSQTAYVKLGTTASNVSYSVQMAPTATFVIDSPLYTGEIDAIWASAQGAMQITELL